MRISMYVCMCHAYVCVYVCMHACMYVYYTYVCVIRMCVCYVFVCVYVCCVCVCVGRTWH